MIEISGLNKRYLTRDGVDIDALKDVNLSVADGEFVTVVGPSGCGKSTLLKILAGTLRRSSGSVKARDIPLDEPAQWLPFARMLARKGKARISVSSQLEYGGQVVGRLTGEFVALRPPPEPTA